MSNDKSRVSIAKCAAYDPAELRGALLDLLSSLGGMEAFVQPGQSVLIKPNLIVPRPAEAAVATNPELVIQIALLAREVGGEVVVGDSPAFSSAAGVARALGLYDRLREEHIPLVDLGRGGRKVELGKDTAPWKRIKLARAALDADVVINVPKVKAHSQAGLSLGLKNCYGTIVGKRKALCHFKNGPDVRDFGRLIVGVARCIAPALTIEDGVVILERDGPTSGDPREGGFLVASPDCTAADRVVVELLGGNIRRVFYLDSAEEMHFGAENMSQIEVTGESIERLRIKDFKQAEREVPIDFTLGRVIRSALKQIGFLLRSRRESG